MKIGKFFLEILTCIKVALIEIEFSFSGKTLICGWNLPYLEVKKDNNDQEIDSPIIPHFRKSSYN